MTKQKEKATITPVNGVLTICLDEALMEQKLGNQLLQFSDTNVAVISVSKPRRKIVAVALAVTLGVFGVHRLYLGCGAKVPVIYTITLGGGFGFLMVSDIVAIITTKDLSRYSPNSRVFMWAE